MSTVEIAPTRGDIDAFGFCTKSLSFSVKNTSGHGLDLTFSVSGTDLTVEPASVHVASGAPTPPPPPPPPPTPTTTATLPLFYINVPRPNDESASPHGTTFNLGTAHDPSSTGNAGIRIDGFALDTDCNGLINARGEGGI